MTPTPAPLRVLITGGAGFLGSHLCPRLLAEGYEVICLDNLLTGSRENMQSLLADPRFVFIRHDVTNPIDLLALLAGSPFAASPTRLHAVLHFASPASPKDYTTHPIHTMKVGALGTYHVLGLARAYGARFILASSSEVYGDPQVNPQPESYWGYVNPLGQRSVYDEAKRYAEAMAMAYHRVHGVDVRIARIFNTYGPRMRPDDGRALPTFINQALSGEPLTVFGNGAQTRSFCYVDDLVDGVYRLMVYEPPEDRLGEGTDAGASGAPVINLGSPEELTILELAREIVALTESRSSLEFRPLPSDDPKVRRPDITRARTILRWTPRISRQDGLRQTIAFFRDRRGAGSGQRPSRRGAQ